MNHSFLKLLICLLLLTAGAQAQNSRETSKGNLLFGLSGSGQISRGDNILVGEIAPNVGIFVKDRILIGGSLQYAVVRYSGKNHHTSLGLYPMARYYFKGYEAHRFFIHGEAGYHRRTAEAYLRHGYGATAGPGIAYFLNHIVALEGLLRLGAHQYTNGTSSVELGFRLGAQFYLRPQR